MAVDEQRLAARAWEADLIDWRGFRIQQMQNWKQRLKKADRLYRGDWSEIFGNESLITENPYVTNLVQSGLEDMTKLVSEAVPSVVCPPVKDSQTAANEALVRAAIARTYWEVNDGELLAPRLAMDLALCGAAFVAAYPDEQYPCYHRINPRFAYPDVANGVLQNLMVLEDLNLRTAAALFPDLGFNEDPTIINSVVEILHYYSAEECLQMVLIKPSAGVDATVDRYYTTKRWKPRDAEGKPYLPVAFAQMDSADEAFRGMFDQITGSLQTKNRLVKQVIDYMDQFVYAPIEEMGVLNPEALSSFGPRTVLHLDPTVQGAGARRIPPAASAPELFNFLDYLDREQRGGVTYPSSRQGEIAQSQAGASFVAATQGSLTTTVRNLQRLIASLRSQLNSICFKIDEADLDEKKPMLFSVQKKNTYTPSIDIKGQYQNRVIYGAGAGLDKMQADVRIMQHRGNGLISAQTAREQIDYISDPKGEQERIEYEMTQNMVMQKLGQMEDPTMLFAVLARQKEGETFAEAVQAEMAAQAQQQAAATPAPGAEGEAPVPGAGPAAPTAGEENLAAQKGGQIQPPVLPPMEQVSVTAPPPSRLTNLGQ